MNMVILLGSAGMLLLAAGCSGNRQKTASAPAASAAPAVSQPARASTSATAPGEPLSLPVPSAGASHDDAWHSEKIKDRFSEGTQLKTTSLDGKYDLVILQEGRQAFLSFARHGRWESAHNQPAKGKLMVLRAKFEDGEEQRIEWDELGFATENLFGMLWSFPAPKGVSFGPAEANSNDNTFGGDRLLIQSMMRHKTMLLEVAPVVTAQFDLTGLARQMERARSPKTEPILEARQAE
jgi:hypothetical protein